MEFDSFLGLREYCKIGDGLHRTRISRWYITETTGRAEDSLEGSGTFPDAPIRELVDVRIEIRKGAATQANILFSHRCNDKI